MEEYILPTLLFIFILWISFRGGSVNTEDNSKENSASNSNDVNERHKQIMAQVNEEQRQEKMRRSYILGLSSKELLTEDEKYILKLSGEVDALGVSIFDYELNQEYEYEVYNNLPQGGANQYNKNNEREYSQRKCELENLIDSHIDDRDV